MRLVEDVSTDDAVALEAILGARGVVVLAPHPDDETLGCGALLAACFATGRPAHVVLMTDGAGSHPGSAAWPPDRLAACRRDEAREAVRRLGGGAADVSFLGLPDRAVPGDGPAAHAAAAEVSGLCARIGAGTILATGPQDAHGDHCATAAIAAIAAEATPGVRVLHYPIWPPDPAGARAHRFPLGRHAGRKRRAIAAHLSQLGGLVHDDPEGFVLPPDFVAAFLDRDEIFTEPADAFRHA